MAFALWLFLFSSDIVASSTEFVFLVRLAGRRHTATRVAMTRPSPTLIGCKGVMTSLGTNERLGTRSVMPFAFSSSVLFATRPFQLMFINRSVPSQFPPHSDGRSVSAAYGTSPVRRLFFSGRFLFASLSRGRVPAAGPYISRFYPFASVPLSLVFLLSRFFRFLFCVCVCVSCPVSTATGFPSGYRVVYRVFVPCGRRVPLNRRFTEFFFCVCVSFRCSRRLLSD